MNKHAFALCAVSLILVTGCAMVGQLTVRDYTAANGTRVMAGEAEPKEEYQCTALGTEEGDWGITGNMDRATAMTRITDKAVEEASRRNGNYVYIDTPAEVGVLGFNVNAFADADVTYYRCNNLPAAGQ